MEKIDDFTSISELNLFPKKELIGIYDLMGRKTERKTNTIQIYHYSDGTSEKVYQME